MLGSVLTKHSEMVSTKQTFSACAPKFQIFPKLNGLGNVPIAVTKICGLGIPQMNTKAFGRATTNFRQYQHYTNLSSDAQSNCLGKTEKTIICENSLRAETGDDDLVNTCHSS